MDSNNADFLIKEGPWKGRYLYDLYAEAHTPYEWMERIFDYARNVRNIEIFASVFDESSVDLLEGLHARAYKIASFELTHIPLIQRVAQTNKPIILSTGMGSTKEIVSAMQAFYKISKKPQLALLHCVSAYPTLPSQANLPALGPLSDLLGGNHVVGLSDHTLGCGVAFAACSRTAPCLMSNPRRADRPMAAMIAVGVARTIVQGHPTTNTATALVHAAANAPTAP